MDGYCARPGETFSIPEDAGFRPRRYWRDCLRGRSWGWTVQFTFDGKKIRRFFSDGRYGSAEASRQAAQTFAHADVAEQAEYLALTRHLRVRTNCRSGIPGVARYERQGRSAYWTAFWNDEAGRKRQRKFSVQLLGEEEAARQAILCRRRAEVVWQDRLAEIQEKLIDAHSNDNRSRPARARTGPKG